jgi:hypothetical protein
VTVESNSADAGGGIFADSTSSLTLSWTVVNRNSASSGGGIGTEGNVSSTNGVVVHNVATNTGNGIGGAGVDIESYDSDGDGTADAGGSFYATNVAIGGNNGTGSIYISEFGDANVANSIVVDNQEGDLVDGENGGTASFTYSNLDNGPGSIWGGPFSDADCSTGCVNDDACFVAWDGPDGDYSDDDLHLDSTSSCVDAGNPSAAFNDTDGSVNDMGAYGGPYGDW